MNGRRSCLDCRATPMRAPFTVLLLLLLLLPDILRSAESTPVLAPRDVMARWTSAPLRYSSLSQIQSPDVAATSQAGSLRPVSQPILVVAHPGLVEAFRLPADTFSEPLNKLNISITLWNGSALPRDYWLSFWPTDRMIVVHCGQSDAGIHDFVIRAVPRSNEFYGHGAVAVALTCLRVIIEEPLGRVTGQAAESSRLAKLTMSCHPPPAAANQPPRATVSSLVVAAERGKELLYELPDNLFSDPEDGSMRHLTLRLFAVHSETRSPTVTHVLSSSPLQLVSARGKRSYLRGLCWEPVQRLPTLSYLLRANDREGAYADVSVQLHITEPPKPAFVFRAQLSVDGSSFSNDVMRQLHFLSNVARVAGDSSTANVSLLDVGRSDQSSAVLSPWHRQQRRSQINPKQESNILVTWTHTGLATAAAASFCPTEEIRSLVRRFMVNETITVAAADVEHGLGSFGIIAIKLEPRQQCLNDLATELAWCPVVAPPATDEVMEAGHSSPSLLTIYTAIALLPVVTFVLMVILIRRHCGQRMLASVLVSDKSDGAAVACGKLVKLIKERQRRRHSSIHVRSPAAMGVSGAKVARVSAAERCRRFLMLKATALPSCAESHLYITRKDPAVAALVDLLQQTNTICSVKGRRHFLSSRVASSVSRTPML